jgi:hypothetical protein
MNRKVLPWVVALAIAMMATVLVAQDKSVTLTGYLIDNACASSHATDKTFPDWVKTHGTSCANMEACQKSGYAVYSGDKLYKLDDSGNDAAMDILKNTKQKKGIQVKVEGTVDGDTIKVSKLTEVTE